MEEIEVLVGRIGKPHGVRGEVTIDVRTDEPERRFAVGTVLRARTPAGDHPAGAPAGLLSVAGTRWHQQRLLVSFDEAPGRTEAEALRGTLLLVDLAADAAPEDPEEYYDHQLAGLTVTDVSGDVLGEVVAVQHGAAQDLLVVRTPDGRSPLVPFVAALVPEVDLERGRLVVADRPGLIAPFDGE